MSIFNLEILIPTVPERADRLKVITDDLDKQINECHKTHPSLGRARYSVLSTPRNDNGGLTVGAKRDRLVQDVKAKYLCFHDDDDNHAPNYIEILLRGCDQNKDVVTFNAIFKTDHYWGLIDMDLRTKENEQATPEGATKRPPWHVCPIRTTIAQKYRFPDINNGEDWEWMKQVLKDLSTQERLNNNLYEYAHSSTTSIVTQMINAGNSNV